MCCFIFSDKINAQKKDSTQEAAVKNSFDPGYCIWMFAPVGTPCKFYIAVYTMQI